METILISGKDFASIQKVAEWGNSLVGHTAPNNPNYNVARIVHFQLLPDGDTYSVMLLAEVEKKRSMSSMVLNMRKDLGFSKSDES